MKKLHVLALALVAAFAFSALVAASASAVEWLDNGAAITAAENTSNEGTLTLKDTTNGVEVSCEGEGAGTVGPGAADKVTLIEKLGKLGKSVPCTLLKAGSVGCEEPTHAEALGLEWVTELTTLTNDVLKAHSGGANPGWKTECTVAGFFKVAQQCSKAETNTTVANNANGTVGDTFSTAEVATCTNGDKATVSGTVAVALTSGHSLSVG